ncbi:MAG TPA: lamin tail domain-containing protein [Pyrinomonadaceae bacterium]|nr:lamin tail domain-containing protein [Pyrinomonadaceae bacterium]
MRKFLLTVATCALVSLCSSNAFATANFVYHEQTANFVATPTCPSGGTDTSAGRYVENTDRSGAAGFQIFSPETYTLHFKIEFQFFTNQLRVYYTTDGSNPSGSFGTPLGTTQVAVASYNSTYSDQTQGCQIVDVAVGAIPPQPAGTTVKYIIGAWHSGGGPEVFSNSGTCTGCFSCTDSTTGCATTFQYNVVAPPATPLIISEFRVRGPNGANDEFVEIYNNSDSDVTVNAFDGSAGFALAASNGVTRFTIPNGTVIPARGHYLGVNSVGYSLAAYPAGNGTTATGDATYTTDIPDNAGIALFSTANPANFTLANRLDAVGSTSEANTLYKEGTGYPALTPFSIDYSFYRDLCGKGGSITTFGTCPQNGLPKDTNNNAADFVFVDTNGTSAGAGQRLGAPGPENLSSPIQRNALLPGASLDATVAASSPPNRVRDTTSDPANNSTFGTLDIRRRYTNNTGANVTRLRFRVIDITTFPAPSGIADMRPRTSTDVVVGGINDPATCPGGTTPCTVTVRGTTLEEPPSQPNGGGFNSSLSAGTITLATPLAPGASINLRFLLGLQQTGSFKFYINIEALP